MNKRSSTQLLCKEYVFTLQDILNGPSCRACLRSYLEKEKNEESLQFLESLEELNRFMSRERDPIKVLSQIDTLVHTYFCAGLYELNISACDKNNLLNSVESVRNVRGTLKSVNKALMNIKVIVEQEMSYDVLPRFLRSDQWLNFIESHGESFMRHHGTLRKAIEMNLSDRDFQDPCIDDAEFEFYHNLLSEDNYNWKLVGFDKKQKIMAFTSKKILEYFPNVSWVANGGSCAKYVGILPFSFELCERYMFSVQKISESDSNVQGVDTLEYLSPSTLAQRFPDKKISNDRSCAVLNYHINLGFPFGSRSCMQVCSGKYNDKMEEAITLQKSCSTSLDPNHSKNDRDMYMISAVTLRRLDHQRTLFSQLHIYNFCSTSANKLAGFIVFKRAKQISKGLIKFLKQQEHLPLVDFDYSDGITRTYLHHKEYVQRETSSSEILSSESTSASDVLA